MRILLFGVVTAFSLLAAPRALAVEALTAAQLSQVCEDYQEETAVPWSVLCIYYVKGFLDGAVATDARVAENVAAEIDEQESFTERAMRTRIGSRMAEFGPSVYADFCVGQPDPIAEVVQHVIDELHRHNNLDDIEAQTIVYDALRRHYPCDAE